MFMILDDPLRTAIFYGGLIFVFAGFLSVILSSVEEEEKPRWWRFMRDLLQRRRQRQ